MKKSNWLSAALVIGAWLTCEMPAQALSDAEEALFRAAAEGDDQRLAMGLSEVDPNVRNEKGETLLMTAAKAGDFACLRALVWSGARAGAKTPGGKVAKDFLDQKSPDFVACNLLLRCYAYLQEKKRVRKPKATDPSLVAVSDNFVDHEHPRLKSRYHVNVKEMGGKKGIDDDRNGFIDDVYGWNFVHKGPPRAPRFSLEDSAEDRLFLSALVEDMRKFQQSTSALERQVIQSRLGNQVRNPLAQQVGASNLAQVGLILDDFKFYEMWTSASHGTHVAGTVLDASNNTARVTSATHGVRYSRKAPVLLNPSATISHAARSDSYAEFLEKVIGMVRSEGAAYGVQASNYLQQLGAGVVNMSWGKPLEAFRGSAREIEKIYKIHGKKPATIKSIKPVGGLDHLENLALELAVADAASFAMVFYENPDVLFIMAAGNESADNDADLPSPQYLSRFFPNAITVASHSPSGTLSSFSNRGEKSVQIAAMGEMVESSVLSNLRAPMSGTSMAAPKVSGVAARIRAENPNLKAVDVRRIIEDSATPIGHLKGKVATGAKLNPTGALKMAKDHKNLVALPKLIPPKKNVLAGKEAPKIDVPPLLTIPKPKPDIKIKLPTPPQPTRRITSVAGRADNWRLVMSAGTSYHHQTQSGIGAFPSQWIDEKWAEGKRITQISGSGFLWNVTMSSGVKGGQRLVGPTFDQNRIAEHIEDGYRITALGGWMDSWMFVMTSGTGWGKQRYTLPTPMTKSRRSWIDQRWAEGYQITSLAGDDDPNKDHDGWLIVMTQGTNLTGQTILGPGPWPGLQLLAKQREGYEVTGLAGSKGRWVVVMSKGSGFKNQVFSPPGPYPVDWVRARWDGKMPATR